MKKQHFSEYVKKHYGKDYQLLQDVSTRWSSTLLMIKRVLLLKKAIIDITNDSELHDLNKFQLVDRDWQTLENYNTILEIPHAFQDILGTESTPTLPYTLPAFAAFIQRWTDLVYNNPDWDNVIQPGLDKLETYERELIKTPAYVLAMAIDPRNKLSYYSKLPASKYDVAKQIFLKALRAYSNPNTPPNIPEHQPASKSSKRTAADILFSNRQYSKEPLPLEIEMEQYLNSLGEGIGILEFWQANQHHYPHIFKLAMDILPIQATSVPCERAFSSGKETMALRRRRISDDLMEALQLLKYSIRKGPSLNFTEGMSWDDEVREFEYMARTAPSEDPDTYGRNLKLVRHDEDELEKIIDEATQAMQELESARWNLSDQGSEIEYISE
ncbi:hypothetical protein APHAL10511_005402 [Amanita phalloides]|nr:hypothetical protein APHAL10511_005402 [Amanita phalloides]